MQLNELLQEVQDRLPAERRRAVEVLVEEYGASEQGRLLMLMAAAATKRERRLLRLLLTDLEKMSMRE